MKNNTYSLLVNANAEEKGRSIFEAAVYGLVVACCAVSAIQFATGEIVVPKGGSTASSQAAFAAAPSQQAEPVRG